MYIYQWYIWQCHNIFAFKFTYNFLSFICVILEGVLSWPHYQFSIFFLLSKDLISCIIISDLSTYFVPTLNILANKYTFDYLFLRWWCIWMYSKLAPLPTLTILAFQFCGDYLFFNQRCIWRCPELAPFLTLGIMAFKLSADYLSLIQWCFWMCTKLLPLPGLKILTFQYTIDNLPLNLRYI